MPTGPITYEMLVFIAAAIATALGLLWRLTVMRDEIVGRIDTMRAEIKAEVDSVEEGLAGTVERLKDDVAAHKLHVAEAYVQKATFGVVSDRISSEVKGLRDEVSARLIRIEDRITHAVEPAPKPPRPRG